MRLGARRVQPIRWMHGKGGVPLFYRAAYWEKNNSTWRGRSRMVAVCCTAGVEMAQDGELEGASLSCANAAKRGAGVGACSAAVLPHVYASCQSQAGSWR